MFARRLIPCLLVALLAAGGASAAGRETGQFDVYLGGIRVGVVSYEAERDAHRYVAEAVVESAGLAGLVRRVRYTTRAEGTVRGERLLPARYEERSDTGRRQSRAVMEYAAGVPRIVQYETTAPRERRGEPVDPATQGGTLDPTTALYLLLRDVAAEDLCALDLPTFDGRRSGRIGLSGGPEPGDRDEVTCRGAFRQIAGFPLRDMSDRTEFPFAVTYRPNGGGTLAVARVAIETLYGLAVLVRR